MMRIRFWVIAVAVVGTTAGAMAAGLLWLMLTRPVDLVEAFVRGL